MSCDFHFFPRLNPCWLLQAQPKLGTRTLCNRILFVMTVMSHFICIIRYIYIYVLFLILLWRICVFIHLYIYIYLYIYIFLFWNNNAPGAIDSTV